MMKKILIGLFCILLLSGCSMKEKSYEVNTIHYDLDISNYYKENITFTFPSNAYDLAKENIDVDYDSLEYILLIDNFSRPIHNNLYTLYGKNIMKFNDAVEVALNFDYLENDFVQSNYMNTCFERHSIKAEDDYFEISLGGQFYCLQDKTMTINVTSNYSEEFTNGQKVGDSFQWVITPESAKDVNIYYKVMRDKKNMATSYGVIKKGNSNSDWIATVEFFIILAVIVGGFIFYKMLYRREFHGVRKQKKR